MSAWTEGLIKRREKADKFAAVVADMGRESDKDLGGKYFEEDPDSERESRIRQILLRRRTRFVNLRNALTDSNSTAFIIVLAAERLPPLRHARTVSHVCRGDCASPHSLRRVRRNRPESRSREYTVSPPRRLSFESSS